MKTLGCHITRLLTGYNEKRHFLDHSLGFAAVWDLSAFIESVIFRITKVGYRPVWKSFFFRPFEQRVFLGFNTIRIDGGPFLVFFETTIPRIPKSRLFLAYLRTSLPFESPNCLGIVAISRHCTEVSLKNPSPLAQNGNHKKITVLHPPQKIIAHKSNERRWTEIGPVRFCFVGRDFARKGGIELLRAFDRLDDHCPKNPGHLTSCQTCRTMQRLCNPIHGIEGTEYLDKKNAPMAQLSTDEKLKLIGMNRFRTIRF